MHRDEKDSNHVTFLVSRFFVYLWSPLWDHIVASIRTHPTDRPRSRAVIRYPKDAGIPDQTIENL